MVDFAAFDTRRYRTVDVRTGYGDWAETYEQTAEDAMDVDLLEVLRKVPWPTIRLAVDLGCGTGRVGAWLREKGVESIDGVDVTPEMLAIARSRSVYDRLIEADVTSSGLASGEYELVTTCISDDSWVGLKPKWMPLRDQPIAFAFVWREQGPDS
jgi:predicted TPR repeat methyltransferase